MKPPAFWFTAPDKPHLMARLLAPLAAIAAFSTKSRVGLRAKHTAKVPVICVGNINMGGTGKTPTVIALVQHYAAQNIKAFVVSRGYGGEVKIACEVNPARMSAKDVGDEPLLIAAFTRVWVSPERAVAAAMAENAGADVIIMDDGHQNPDITKDFSIVVVDAAAGFGNGRVTPAGPLREPVDVGLARADLVVSIGTPADQSELLGTWPALNTRPMTTAHLKPLEMGIDWNGHKVLAFAGIGRPAKFFDTLRGLGANLVKTISLNDHQPLSRGLLSRMIREAASLNAQLVTTEKDAVRLPAKMRGQVLTLPVRLEFDDPAALDGLPMPQDPAP